MSPAEQLVLEPAAPAQVPAPTPEQRRAIDAAENRVLLEAGAGSGKTLVIVERFCDAVEADGTDGVVAFTFTERAAAELRARIRAELDRRAEQAEDRERQTLLTSLAQESDRAWISTIHGFCRRLLASHPVALGLDPRFRVLDEPEAARLAAGAFDEALEEFLDDADPQRARLVAAMRTRSLREIVTAAHGELRSRGLPVRLPEPDAPDVESALGELRRAGAAAHAETEGGRGGAVRRERLRRASELPGEVTEAELAGLELDSDAKAFCGVACREYKRVWRRTRQALAERDSIEAYRMIAELTSGFDRRYEELKEGRSGLDFEDLQLRARELLRDHPRIAAVYRERFRHVLVDEFQDTNALQLELVRLLAGDETVVFSVGDEFQSIYGFRHADVEVFRRERDRLRAAGGAAVLPLRGNFRSVAPLVAAANALGEILLEGFVPLRVAREEAAEDEPGEPLVDLLLTPKGAAWKDSKLAHSLPGDYPSSPDRVAEARFLAERLRRLVEAGTPPGDIVVLLRAFTHVAAFEEALERAGLRPYVVGGRGYWSQQQVDDLRRVLAVIANPLDDESLLGMLASPAGNVLPDTLWALRRAAGRGRHLWPVIERRLDAPEADADDEHAAERARWLAEIPAGERERLRAARDHVLELRRKAPLVELDRLIDEAMVMLGYDLAVLRMPRGRQRWANVRKLMTLAREFERTEGRDLRGFLRHLDDRAATDREGEAATEAEDHDGVRVMTVHAAKGLEFPVVALADLGRGLLDGARPPGISVGEHDGGAPPATAGDDAVPALRVGIRMARFAAPAVGVFGYDDLVEQAVGDAAAEARRLAYVGFTRARDRLVLSGTYGEANVAKAGEDGLADGTPVTERLIRGLDLTPGEDTVVPLPAAAPRPGLELDPAPGAIAVRFTDPDRDARAGLAALSADDEGPAQQPLLSPPLARPVARSGGARHLSYSALALYGRCGYRFYVERMLGLPAIERAPGGETGGRAGRFAFGNAVHALLEWSARRRWREPPNSLVAETLAKEGIREDEQGTRALEMVRGWLDSDLRRALDPEVRAEVPFVLPLGEAVIRGTMDLLSTRDGVPLVLDYKTDALGERSVAEHVDRYGVQREVYALAAAGAAERVRTAYVFLERPSEPVELELEADALAAARERLAGMVREIRAGRFEVTPEPHTALCHDCPARARLCSHPPELTGRRLERA